MDLKARAREFFQLYIPTGDAGEAEIEDWIKDLADTLRVVWNERGLADRRALTGYTQKNLRDTIAALDAKES